MSTWIQTYTGKKFDVFNVNPDMIDIEDIAHALSNIGRWGGFAEEFRNVAEHSLDVADLMRHYVAGDRQLELTGLLHDAAEAYIGDIPRPIKHAIPEFIEIENNILKVIMEKYGGLYPLPDAIHEADDLILRWEAWNLMPDKDIVRSWAGSNPFPNKEMHFPTSNYHCSVDFLNMFSILQGK